MSNRLKNFLNRQSACVLRPGVGLRPASLKIEGDADPTDFRSHFWLTFKNFGPPKVPYLGFCAF